MLLLLVLTLSPTLGLQQSSNRTAKAFMIGPKIDRELHQKVPTYLPELAEDEKREAFRYEQTLVIRDAGKDDNVVRRCGLIEINDENMLKPIYANISLKFNLEVEEVTVGKMFNLMDDCDSVDANLTDTSREKGPFAITHGIYPGTKWCGSGNIASKYHDLGKSPQADRCCRAHDFCPLKVLAKQEHYGLKNTGTYTKSHCLCDEAFHDCLKKTKGYTASFIGTIYFRVLRPKCIRGRPEYGIEYMEFVKASRKW